MKIGYSQMGGLGLHTAILKGAASGIQIECSGCACPPWPVVEVARDIWSRVRIIVHMILLAGAVGTGIYLDARVFAVIHAIGAGDQQIQRLGGDASLEKRILEQLKLASGP